MNEGSMERVWKAIIIQELVKGVYRRFNHFRFSHYMQFKCLVP
jgi:hypothetical protein